MDRFLVSDADRMPDAALRFSGSSLSQFIPRTAAMAWKNRSKFRRLTEPENEGIRAVPSRLLFQFFDGDSACSRDDAVRKVDREGVHFPVGRGVEATYMPKRYAEQDASSMALNRRALGK